MRILGLKLTHDAAIALIDSGHLVFSYEMEKLNNFPRYSTFCISWEEIEDILDKYGYSFDSIDQVVIDGWSAWDPYKLTRSTGGQQTSTGISRGGRRIVIATNDLAGYGHVVGPTEDILAPRTVQLEDRRFCYKSYQHISGHFAGIYCTSPFAKRGEEAYCLIWDGGMPPQLFYYQPVENRVINLGALFPLIGYVYINFPYAFRPFNKMKFDLSIAGKAMAYMALGHVQPKVLDKYRSIFGALLQVAGDDWKDIDVISILTAQFIKEVKQFSQTAGYADEDLLTTFQEFVKELLIRALTRITNRYPGYERNLCIGGGCALNIKWNHAIREHGLFKEVWVPPFPNDAGSALGTACCEMITQSGIKYLSWDVYSGPPLNKDESDTGSNAGSAAYSGTGCTIAGLAKLIHELDEPVVFLNGRAELGPRALGNRSIIAPAVSGNMKERLNGIKNREHYRPVAPICLEEYAADIFDPGTPDPFMLFEHFVRQSWVNRIPAIRHLDGSARLQTITRDQNKAVYDLLAAYHRISGIPVLCNTSANFNGSGFFPDVASAFRWGKANLIWSDDRLFVRNDYIHFRRVMAPSALARANVFSVENE